MKPTISAAANIIQPHKFISPSVVRRKYSEAVLVIVLNIATSIAIRFAMLYGLSVFGRVFVRHLNAGSISLLFSI